MLFSQKIIPLGKRVQKRSLLNSSAFAQKLDSRTFWRRSGIPGQHEERIATAAFCSESRHSQSFRKFPGWDCSNDLRRQSRFFDVARNCRWNGRWFWTFFQSRKWKNYRVACIWWFSKTGVRCFAGNQDCWSISRGVSLLVETVWGWRSSLVGLFSWMIWRIWAFDVQAAFSSGCNEVDTVITHLFRFIG